MGGIILSRKAMQRIAMTCDETIRWIVANTSHSGPSEVCIAALSQQCVRWTQSARRWSRWSTLADCVAKLFCPSKRV